MAVTRVDYPHRAVAAAWSVLLELAHLLGEYRDSIVLLGGLVPRLLIAEAREPHIGSVDVDLGLDQRRFDESGYDTIHELLWSRGYVRDARQPFIYRRSFLLDDRPVVVQLDLLSGEYGGTARSRRTQQVQGTRPRKARGADLAFEHAVEVEVSGTLPNGGADKARIRVAGIVPFVVMKSMALKDRMKEKDAYDLYYCLVHYPGAPQSLVEAFRRQERNRLVTEALACLSEKFASPEHIGSKFVADFLEIVDPVAREQIQRDAYERMAYFLAGVQG